MSADTTPTTPSANRLEHLLGELGLITEAELLALCAANHPDYLNRLHYQRRGPPRVRLGNVSYYPVADLRLWLAERVQSAGNQSPGGDLAFPQAVATHRGR